MKRLIFLTLILSPLALTGLRVAARGPHDGHGFGPRHARHERPAAAGGPVVEKAISGLPMATPERARQDARRVLRTAVADWVAPAGVPRSWHAPAPLLDSLIQTDPIEESARDYGTVYVQTLRLDASQPARERVIQAYERELAGRRLVTLGGVLAFVLACLAVLAGYIRADEATKGYYTNRLRLAAAAGVGAAGVALYRVLV